MTATYIRAYVKRENGWDGNTQTTLSDPFTESKFLSLQKNHPEVIRQFSGRNYTD